MVGAGVEGAASEGPDRVVVVGDGEAAGVGGSGKSD